MDFIVLTGNSIVNEKHMQADNLSILLSNINITEQKEVKQN